VRTEAQYTPAKAIYGMTGAVATSAGALVQQGGSEDTTGFEVRGRIDVDARTQSAWGTVQTAVSLRGTNASGLRTGVGYSSTGGVSNTPSIYGTTATFAVPATNATNLTMEKAFIRFAGLTIGVAPENYGFMPSFNYNGNPWTGYPNGMPQIAYTYTFGGGWSATLAAEDIKAGNYAQIVQDNPRDQISWVGNVRLDQSWGFAALHAAYTMNSVYTGAAFSSNAKAGGWATQTNDGTYSVYDSSGYAVGATAKINLPMLASGDALWLTANYANGNIGQLLSNGNLMNLSSSSGGRVLGGLYNSYVNMNLTGGSTLAPTSSNTTGYNIAGELTHYWAPQWRSNLSAGYVDLKAPTSTYVQVGESKLYELMGSLIWSPVKDFDIGVEVQYLHLNTGFNAGTAGQQASTAVAAAGIATSADNWTSKLRLERSF
jgi:Porin subfamily